MKNSTRHHQGEVVCAVGRCNSDVDPAIGAPLCEHHAKLVFVKVATIYGMSLPPKQKARPVKHAVSPVGTVYIVQHGTRVKIGFTRDLAQRMQYVPHDRIIATFAGRVEAEQALHEKFSHLRTVGEWFKAEPELVGFAEAIGRRKAS